MVRSKILYIEHGLHQKQASKCLEDAAALCGYQCSFTVVSDTLQGLECVSFTSFNLIIVDEDMPCFPAADFALVLRKNGIRAPLVLLESRTGAAGVSAPTLPLPPRSSLFVEVLRRPFSPAMMCQILERILFHSTAPYSTFPLAPTIPTRPQKRPRYDSIRPAAAPYHPHAAPFYPYPHPPHFHPLHPPLPPPPPHFASTHSGAFYFPTVTNDLRQLLSSFHTMSDPIPPPGDFPASQFVAHEETNLFPPIDHLSSDQFGYSTALSNISEGDEGSTNSLPSTSLCSPEPPVLTSTSSDSMSEDLWSNCEDLVAREAFGILFGVDST